LYFKKKEILVLFLTNCHPLTKKLHKNIKNTTNIIDKITKKTFLQQEGFLNLLCMSQMYK